MVKVYMNPQDRLNEKKVDVPLDRKAIIAELNDRGIEYKKNAKTVALNELLK